MNITEITVSYGITQSLPGYSNVKPALTLTARIQDGDDALKVEAFLFDHARCIVHEQADQALEAAGEPALFSTEPRYDLILTTRPQWGDLEGWTFPMDCCALVPSGVDLPTGWANTHKNRMRYRQALGQMQRKAHERRLMMIDCSDGDLSRLPEMVPPPSPITEMARAIIAEAADNEATYGYEDGDNDDDDILAAERDERLLDDDDDNPPF